MANRSLNAILAYGQITIGNILYTFQTSSIYKTPAVGTACGITYLAPDSFAGNEPLVKIEQLIRAGKLVRLSALLQNPTDGGKNKRVDVLTDPNKAITARTDLIGKTLVLTKNGNTRTLGKVLKVSAKTRDRFS